MGRKQLTWEKLVRVANSTKSKTRIYSLKELDKSYPHNKRPLKLTFNK